MNESILLETLRVLKDDEIFKKCVFELCLNELEFRYTELALKVLSSPTKEVLNEHG